MNLRNKDYHKNEIEAHVSSNDLCLYEDVDCVHMQKCGSWTCIFVFMYHEIVMHADVHFHSETQLNHFSVVHGLFIEQISSKEPQVLVISI